jgi:hypothetical protein
MPTIPRTPATFLATVGTLQMKAPQKTATSMQPLISILSTLRLLQTAMSKESDHKSKVYD